ncbi:MAG: hydrogenase expression/formation protein HypE [Planctomycetota bacterium]
MNEARSSAADDASCPVPLTRYSHVSIAHGGGGRLMRQLIEEMFVPAFGGASAVQLNDSAVVARPTGRVALTTDSFVVRPLFFPGGDIGRLAVFGTVNDLAMSGARPLYLSVSFILEEGLPLETLWRVVQSIARAAREAGVTIVTGDTKVVDRGLADGLYITTSGMGVFLGEDDRSSSPPKLLMGPQFVQPGDAIVVSGDVGRHGIAVLAQREGLQFETTLESDLAALVHPVTDLLSAGLELHCLRDLTRGGLATAVCEVAQSSCTRALLDEASIGVHPAVRAACELLGFDPLYVANEGRFAVWLPAAAADQAVEILQRHAPLDSQPAVIGVVDASAQGEVVLRTRLGGHRPLDLLSGEQLPRIC